MCEAVEGHAGAGAALLVCSRKWDGCSAVETGAL